MESYDYIIAGGGAAGLSLAFHFCREAFGNKRILIIDKAPKHTNDRTWAFWKNQPFAFDPIIYKSWREIEVKDHEYYQHIPLKNYSYNVIKGIDFYSFVHNKLRDYTNIAIVYDEVLDIKEEANGAQVITANNHYRAEYVFNSCYHLDKVIIPASYHYLKQHFKGWVVKSLEKPFNPDTATIFDFNINQGDSLRFIYTLPFDDSTALIEYTIFSEDLLPPREYEEALKNYIAGTLGINNFTIEEEEFGSIPMTNFPFSPQYSKHIVNLGTLGGRTKASTGYTFTRIQKQSTQIIESLLTTGGPWQQDKEKPKYKLFDSVLLNVLKKERGKGHLIFKKLFQKNDIGLIFRFLDDETSLTDEVKIMNSLSSPVFIRAFFEELLKWKR